MALCTLLQLNSAGRPVELSYVAINAAYCIMPDTVHRSVKLLRTFEHNFKRRCLMILPSTALGSIQSSLCHCVSVSHLQHTA